MRKSIVTVLCLLLAALFFAALPAPSARASG